MAMRTEPTVGNATFGFEIAPAPQSHMEEDMEVTSNSPTRPMTVTPAVPQTGFNRPHSGNTPQHGHTSHAPSQHHSGAHGY